MKQRSEHKTTVRQENKATVRTQDHRKTGEWNNGQNTRPPEDGMKQQSEHSIFWWSCVLSVVSFSCLTVVLWSDGCFILLSYGGLVFWPLFHSPKQPSEHKTTVRHGNKTTVRTQDHCKTGEWNNGQNTRPPEDGMKQQSEHKTIVRQENETCFILLSYGDLVFWLLFHPPVLRWSCVLSVVSFCFLTMVLCSVRCQQPEHKTTVKQENETTNRTQDHCKTGEWNNRQNTRPDYSIQLRVR
jgi:hypothetical protein